jgi:hypothetical protein
MPGSPGAVLIELVTAMRLSTAPRGGRRRCARLSRKIADSTRPPIEAPPPRSRRRQRGGGEKLVVAMRRKLRQPASSGLRATPVLTHPRRMTRESSRHLAKPGPSIGSYSRIAVTGILASGVCSRRGLQRALWLEIGATQHSSGRQTMLFRGGFRAMVAEATAVWDAKSAPAQPGGQNTVVLDSGRNLVVDVLRRSARNDLTLMMHQIVQQAELLRRDLIAPST